MSRAAFLPRAKEAMILNGFKYLALSAAVLFLAVFGLTRLSGIPADGSEGGGFPSLTSSDNSKELIINNDEYTPSGASTAVAATSEDPDEADNPWAMFLVNEQNPLPVNYDNYLELELVDETYREYYMDKRCAKYMKQMLRAAEKDGIKLITSSTYRTFDYQKQNFENSVSDRVAQGMTEAEAYRDALRSVQLPGQSEHNAGLAVDILSNEYTSMDDDGFENTKAFEWLSKHASEYGFILRYPKGKTEETGIIYEPWHYRFVGVYYAKDVEASGLCLEEYFAKKGWTDTSGRAVKNTVYDRNPGLPRSEEIAEPVKKPEGYDELPEEDEENTENGDGSEDSTDEDSGEEDYIEPLKPAIPKVPEFTDDEFKDVLNDDSVEEIIEYEDE